MQEFTKIIFVSDSQAQKVLPVMLSALFRLILHTVLINGATGAGNMEQNLPEFHIKWARLNVPTLELTSRVLSKPIKKEIDGYAANFAQTLMRHFSFETEVQIIGGELAKDSKSILTVLEQEMEMLQYKHCLNEILIPWKLVLRGQPVSPEIGPLLDDYVQSIIKDFENFIMEIQASALRNRRSSNNSLCKAVCSSKNKILNLTETEIPADLEKAFANGSNFVPMEPQNFEDLKSHIDNDLILASINFFRDQNQVYPLVNKADGLKTVLEQLISQSPSNSYQVEFYTSMHEYYMNHKNQFYDKLSEGHFNNNPAIQKLLPLGTILTESDKGLGPCLLPLEWYIEQYKVQSLKGNHVETHMSCDQCINYLKNEIDLFRSGLSTEGKILLKSYFSNCNPNFRVGVLKMIPKIHKLSEFGKQAWKKLPSRPIRGAENCPINPYSQALCKMLQEMHSSLKIAFSEREIAFPAIYGCDEYSSKIQGVALDSSAWSFTTLVSGDFSDAYTKSNLADLQNSIKDIGHIVGWVEPKIQLAQNLAKLVFENCFFETPNGILKQTQGFPMGGHSSREGLDNILLAGEFDLLTKLVNTSLIYYYRLVDDISIALNGNFASVRKLLSEMAKVYPRAMPLNIQISFGYSHFLDSHVYNFLQPSPTYKLTTTLAYKPLSRFDYVPFNSNIAPCYKGKQI